MYRQRAIVPRQNVARTSSRLLDYHDVILPQNFPLPFVSATLAELEGIVHVRAYKNIEAVAAAGSKYLIREVGEVKSFGSAAILPFLDDLPEELMEALRCRDAVWWAEDDIVALVT